MTAPYERIYVPQAVGQNRDRVKKLEGADRLPGGPYDPFYPVGGEWIVEDDGSSPNGYFAGGTAYVSQEGIVNGAVEFIAVGGWAPGTGTRFLFGLAVTPDAWWGTGDGILGYGYAYSLGAGATTPLWFEVDTVTPYPVAGYVYAHALVQSDLSIVGPGNPYVWASGDIIFKGQLNYNTTWLESITV